MFYSLNSESEWLLHTPAKYHILSPTRPISYSYLKRKYDYMTKQILLKVTSSINSATHCCKIYCSMSEMNLMNKTKTKPKWWGRIHNISYASPEVALERARR